MPSPPDSAPFSATARPAPSAAPAGPGRRLPPPAATAQAVPRAAPPLPEDGRARAVIDAVLPVVDGGRFAVKRVAGEAVRITAHCFTDGHDVPRAMLQWWKEEGPGAPTAPAELPMHPEVNDEWWAEFTPPDPGLYRYTVVAWVDAFESWRHDMQRRVDPADIRVAARVGAADARAAAMRAAAHPAPADARQLEEWAEALERGAREDSGDAAPLKALALQEAAAEAMRRHPDRSLETRHPVALPLRVDRERARFSTWYELFPRSTAAVPGMHGTFRDVEGRLADIAAMGFDVLYFPPIHPIGRVQRKGRNNTLAAAPGDVGSPWAIGADEGGHKSIHPELGTPEDFCRLVARAREHGIEIALDIAFQCAPDHPYVREHPDWFRWRPDGTVQYAENPPKKYQDIYPFHFECEDWQGLWQELRSVFAHWIGEGVRIFRVDNPHTKAFGFWEWVIGDIQREHPDVLFLAEAFTRPKVMHGLAKRGYTQSYTYFTWRNTRQELQDYFIELNTAPGRDYFRPNVWPNTPDILHAQLQGGEPAMFALRLVLAATLSANYGIYGPAYELLEHLPREPGSEEYRDSEKYQLRHWDLERPGNLRPLIARVNHIRRAHPALQADHSLRFLPVDNDMLLAYLKRSPDGRDVIVTVVNLDPHHAQSGWMRLSPADIAIAAGDPPAADWQMHDLLSQQRFLWQGDTHYVLLDPQRAPAHIFAVRRRVAGAGDIDPFQ
ncbi:alpha-1,4-glucan--maltose-1-phosphate maltosyltransferase [Acidovorax sp. NCPPB 3859]|nr:MULTISPECIES: alpha-1,4-glucan--maltose-1-phosphate maltosyltransferase [unclassified Acidovorax]MDA8452566.1 alpha-1,4-glucan--maltose-1-phosphate maltosyltransferase [Acidovorax sp. GBBC 3297]MDA8461955.1 alpha-1,4-glucan--maltose-1-phosphate maltosyltransferase [Acidovorax sp. GBBC 3333]MDA8466988.1 alpha-1,4-glucan--maltose-1-phosphate maltosyltransferase [Acidovorax sp. GBBC 3332]MDA8472024.1 alpha-1,4-glucan--maltose-1-phosphate maltosyltransferase [Acidovorax sp. GBBC 3299]WCM77115.1